MNKYYYDLHIHSCLSPCADNDNTPNNIAGMGCLNGLNIMALTDHNSTKNCPAFFAAAKKNGIIPIAGMELTTSEDVHMICLFEFLEDAMRFDALVEKRLIPIKNRADIFGEQLIMDENDKVTAEAENLLINATDISVTESKDLVESYGGICYPAHIDREANGILTILGMLPESPKFSAFEIHDSEKAEELIKKCSLYDKPVIISSDAHYLWDIKEKKEYFLIPDEPYSSKLVREKLFKYLRNEDEGTVTQHS